MLKCPNCGHPFQVICLTSLPPKYESYCGCGFAVRYVERNNSSDTITQEELDEGYKKLHDWSDLKQ